MNRLLGLSISINNRLKMIDLHNNNSGYVQVLGAVLVAIAIGVMGVAAVQVGDSEARHRRSLNRHRGFNRSTTVPRPAANYNNTGARATCTVNGQTVPAVNGRCTANSASTPGVTNSTTTNYTSQGAPGAPGTTRCSVTNSDGTTTTKADGTPCVAY
jgi:hypothetical protein